MDTESRDRALEDLRTIVDKVEQKAHVPPDNPDLVALWQIVEHKIADLESEEDSDSGHRMLPSTQSNNSDRTVTLFSCWS
jgi:hypothetical protein